MCAGAICFSGIAYNTCGIMGGDHCHNSTRARFSYSGRMESRLFQYSIPYFSFDNVKFHSMGNEDLDGERGSIRWGTTFYSMGNEVLYGV